MVSRLLSIAKLKARLDFEYRQVNACVPKCSQVPHNSISTECMTVVP